MGRTANFANIVAGLAVAGLILPESIAYGSIAGLPPEHALAAALAGLTVYAIAGKCRVAIVAPTSASAAVLASALTNLGGTAEERLVLTLALVGCVGLLFVLAGLLRLGFIAAFISRPVLHGFAFGLAASIVLKQLFSVTGVQITASWLAGQFVEVLGAVAHWNLLALSVAGGAGDHVSFAKMEIYSGGLCCAHIGCGCVVHRRFQPHGRSDDRQNRARRRIAHIASL